MRNVAIELVHNKPNVTVSDLIGLECACVCAYTGKKKVKAHNTKIEQTKE